MMIRLGNSSSPICTGVKSGSGRAVEISFNIAITTIRFNKETCGHLGIKNFGAPIGSLIDIFCYYLESLEKQALRRRLCHQVIELRHKRAFVWSGIVTERLGAFHKNLARVGT